MTLQQKLKEIQQLKDKKSIFMLLAPFWSFAVNYFSTVLAKKYDIGVYWVFIPALFTVFLVPLMIDGIFKILNINKETQIKINDFAYKYIWVYYLLLIVGVYCFFWLTG